jgi:hypothetical protein
VVRASRRSHRSERASTLLLFPAALLIVLVLGAISADLAAVFLGERELANATAAAANDAATEALANAAFYGEGRVQVADGGASEVAGGLVRGALSSSRYRNVQVQVDVLADRVTVRATAEVRRLFAAAIPGGFRWAPVGATSTVRATERLPG